MAMFNEKPASMIRGIKPFLIGMILVSFLQGCATVYLRTPLPEDKAGTAKVPGVERARIWGDEPPPYIDYWLNMPREEFRNNFPALFGSRHNYLAISGGGANGAFGAGLLVGWTAAGNRPQFSIVTGISTGSLTAPFAFLGSKYDAQLKEIYTTYTTKDLVRERYFLKILTGDSAVSTLPLQRLIAKYFNADVLEEIRAEHEKGRRLFIGTTNLDAERPVIWNIGEILESGIPNSADLVHKIILASASIPGAFPPVFINVEAEGKRYDEIHVDGGTASQVFLYPVGMDWAEVGKKFETQGRPNAYVIRNSRLDSEWETVEPKLVPIASRSIDSLIKNQGIGDLYRLYLSTQRDGINFHLACIPADFDEDSTETFDPVYMGKLFELGYNMAKSGYPWQKVPPGFMAEP